VLAGQMFDRYSLQFYAQTDFAVILYKVHETICLFYYFISEAGGLMNVTAPMLNVAGHLFFCIVFKRRF